MESIYYEFLWQAFMTMVIIIDPFLVVPVFVTLSNNDPQEHKIKTAKKSCIIALILLLFFAISGDKLLDLIGISEPAFRIAGGFLMLLASLEMVVAKPSGLRSPTGDETKEAIRKDDISVFPLAIPLIAGPGSLTSSVVLMRQAENISMMAQIGLLIIIFVVILITYIFMRCGVPVMKKLGVTGTNVLTRVFGIILTALAVQNILNGLTSVFKSVFHH